MGSEMCIRDRHGTSQQGVEYLLTSTEHLPFFADLSPAVHRALMEQGGLMLAQKGFIVAREGASSTAAYVILHGAVGITKDPTPWLPKDDKSLIAQPLLATKAKGGSFGEVGLLQSLPRTATVFATEPTVLLTIPQALYTELGGAERQAIRASNAQHLLELELFSAWSLEAVSYTHLTLPTICSV